MTTLSPNVNVNVNVNKYYPLFNIITTPYDPTTDGTGITIIFPDECLIEITQDINNIDNINDADDIIIKISKEIVPKTISILPQLPEYSTQISPNSFYDDELNPSQLHVFAMSYNVLRIMSGMSGLSYSS